MTEPSKPDCDMIMTTFHSRFDAPIVLITAVLHSTRSSIQQYKWILGRPIRWIIQRILEMRLASFSSNYAKNRSFARSIGHRRLPSRFHSAEWTYTGSILELKPHRSDSGDVIVDIVAAANRVVLQFDLLNCTIIPKRRLTHKFSELFHLRKHTK